MYIVLVYDINVKRVGRMLKLCRQYLHWIQNSVFEGDLSEAQLEELKSKARKIMKAEEDSMILFKSRDQKWLDKEIVGIERSETDNIL